MIPIPRWLSTPDGSRKTLISLLGCKIITGVASTCVTPFIVLHMTKTLGMNVPLAAAAMTVLAVLPGISGPLVGIYQDRVSSKFLLSAACVLAASALALLLGSAGNRPIIFFSVGLLGLASSVFSVSFNAALPRFLPSDRLPLAFSLMHSTANIGAMLGPAMAGGMILGGGGTRQVILSSIGLYIIALLALPLLLPPESPSKAPWHIQPAASPMMSLSSTLFWMSFAYLAFYFLDWAHFEQTNSFLSQFTSDYFHQPAIAGFFFSAQAIPVVVLVPLAGKRMEGWSTEKLLKTFILGVLALPLGFIGFSVVGRIHPYSGLIILGMFMVFDEMLAIPSGGTLAARLVPNKKYGAIFGWRASVLALGRAFGISAGGYFLGRSEAAGAPVNFWLSVGAFFLALWAAAGCVTLLLKRATSSAPALEACATP